MKLIIDIDEDVYKLFTGNGQGMKVVRFNLENTLKNGILLEEELKKLRLQIHNIEEPDHDFEGFFQCQDEAIEIISKAIDELKGEVK